MKEWIGNDGAVFKTLGASNHTDNERETNDYYATDPIAIDVLIEQTGIPFDKNIWECACGGGHISKRLSEYGFNVRSTDLIDRGFGEGNIDFLNSNETWDGDIITNPPYRYADRFVERAMESITDGHKVAMFLKVLFLEGKNRRMLFDKYPPKYVFVSSSRIKCAKNADFDGTGSSAVAYAWYVWEKGYTGDTYIKWVN